MIDPLRQLLSILDLKPMGEDRFLGQSGSSHWQRVFGGHVIAQALMAASHTVIETRFVHSLHAYFLRPGSPNEPILYEVERLRDGGSFSSRRVVAKQSHGVILSFSASFQCDEVGLDYHYPMPKGLPDPESLATEHQINEWVDEEAPFNVKHYWSLLRPFTIRPLDFSQYLRPHKGEPQQTCWFAFEGVVDGTLDRSLFHDRRRNAALLAYLSDMAILNTALLVHGRSIFAPDIQAASLDHSVWFHRPAQVDDWLLYALDSPNTNGSRGFGRGFIYSRDGHLLASVAQEGLVRLHTPKAS
ncbi:acyl-CoA thioesterase [Bartonella sp. DGB2]|uniref:acyl-CoA thioesterase n=1 Tax=Bartonella sp. DGB2 TaxID=3388426 RepID=UPI00398FF218